MQCNIFHFSFLGHGESILKFCLAHSIIKLMESGADASTATTNAVNGIKNVHVYLPIVEYVCVL